MNTTQIKIDALSKNHEEFQRNIKASIKNLKMQIEQIST